MSYYDEYIRESAEQAFDYEKAEFSLYDQDHEEMKGCLNGALNENLFIGAMFEMVTYLYEHGDGGDSMEMLFDPDNVEVIYISAKGLEAPTVIVEYEELPDWFQMKNADLREFYWHPKPALSGELTAGYFQPR